MALANQIIVVPSSKADLLGTGLEATAFDWDRVETIELSARSYVYPSGDQNLSTVQAAIKLQNTYSGSIATIIDFWNSYTGGPTVPCWTFINDNNQNGTNDLRICNTSSSNTSPGNTICALSILQSGSESIIH